MSTSAEEFDREARGEFARLGKTRVHRGELLRHPVYTRFLHWSVAIFFILALLSGFAIYSSWLFRWLAPLFGGGARTRALHPWFGVGFEVFFLFQFINWFAPMAWTIADRRWLRRLKAYATHERMTFEEVTEARSRADAAESQEDRALAENALSGALGRLLATAEAYPDLKAEERFQDLQEELVRLEDTIVMARQAYNLTVQAYNNNVQTVPTNIVAWFASFKPRAFLSTLASEMDVPAVEFSVSSAA